MSRPFIPLLFLSFSLFLNAQQRCGTDYYMHELQKNNLEYTKARKKVNTETENWIANNPNYDLNSIITIPVVVHVVWNTNQENISDNQIFSQIDVLNADYRRTNIDAINTPNVWQAIAADCEIEFCLATIDPNGNPTTGITRTQTSQTSFSMNGDNMKSSSSGGIDAWPTNQYLNIWVCDLTGGVLGYATLPSSFSNPNDGVVIGYRYFGTIGTVQPPYNKGRTTTHEVGHWLNLEHVWGFGNCGNDYVSDTPKQEEENYSCPSFPANANSCQTNNPNGDMFMNYMDYTNDACMNLFTQGQKTRMISAINQYRSNLLNHNLCGGPPPNASWNCVNGNCIDPGNGTGMYNDYNICISQCNCIGIPPPYINESFQANVLPSDWSIVNPDGNQSWEITSAAGYNSSSSIYINNAEYPANGEYDDLILPVLDFSPISSSILKFDYAYSLWTNPSSSQVWSDTLQVWISSDCGTNWQKIWEKSGVNLVTTSPLFNAFSWTPNNTTDWSQEIIDLSNYTGEEDLVIKFRNINDYENNLYLDNIEISGNTGINSEIESILITPNPANSHILNTSKKEIIIYTLIGEEVMRTDSYYIDITNLSNGVYIIRLDNNRIEKLIKK